MKIENRFLLKNYSENVLLQVLDQIILHFEPYQLDKERMVSTYKSKPFFIMTPELSTNMLNLRKFWQQIDIYIFTSELCKIL